MYTFDSFVVGESSRAAFDAAVAVAENPGRVHNLLVLFGRTGCGKSHLLVAIEHAMRTRFPAMKIVRASAHAFAAQLVLAIRSQTEQELERFDAILLDDFHFRADRPCTEAAVLLVLERARTAGAQIVMASPSPRAFAAATMVEVGHPNVSARMALARREATKHGLHLADDALCGIAKGSPVRIRSSVARMAAMTLAATIPPCGNSSSPRLPLLQSPSS